MYGLCIKAGLLVLPSHHHGSIPFIPSTSSNECNLLFVSVARQFQNSKCILLFPCKLFTIGPTCLNVESAPAYSIQHCFTHTHQARTYIHTEPSNLLQPSKPNYSLPSVSLCQPVMSATERQWDSWLGASEWPHWCRGGKERQEVKRRLALERFAK